MNETLRLSPEGANLIKAFESCLRPVGNGRFAAYLDPIGVPTIGWGHTNHHGRQFKIGDLWTQKECDDEFAKDMSRFERAVRTQVTVPLKQHQFDALVSFAFNCGEGNLARSTLLRKVNAKDFAGAAKEFARWNKAGGRVLNGLTRRRASESLLFQGIPDTDYDGRPDKVKPPVPGTGPLVAPAHRPDAPKSVAPAATGTTAGVVVAAGGAAAAAHAGGAPLWLVVAIAAAILGLALGLYLWWKGRKP